jgi:hypothetical protein
MQACALFPRLKTAIESHDSNVKLAVSGTGESYENLRLIDSAFVCRVV